MKFKNTEKTKDVHNEPLRFELVKVKNGEVTCVYNETWYSVL